MAFLPFPVCLDALHVCLSVCLPRNRELFVCVYLSVYTNE